jgi:hypothetical protein
MLARCGYLHEEANNNNTRAKSTMNRYQSEHEVILLYLFKHEDQLLGPGLLAQIRYITDDIDTIPIQMKKARSVIRSFLERAVSTGLHPPIKFEDLKPTDLKMY